jgi:HEAT repeat protein
MKRMRALGRRGPGIVPKRFKLLLHDERDHFSLWQSFRTWVERASAGDIVAAYEVCRNPGLRAYICYRVGRRGLHAALPMLVHALNDPDRGVRAEAADALKRIGDRSTGYDLFKRLKVEEDPEVRFWLLVGLGRTQYASALPALADALADANRGSRYQVARALAHIGDKAALPALRQAYAEEPEGDYSHYSLKESLRRIIDELERG